MDRPDFLKLGVFLLGLSSIILSSLALHMYLFEDTVHRGKLDAWCYVDENNLIVVMNARTEVSDVKVMSKDRQVICSFEKIPKGSEEICDVNSTGLFLIVYEGGKEVVTCQRPREIVPVPAEKRIID